jgi:hypothetical protein
MLSRSPSSHGSGRSRKRALTIQRGTTPGVGASGGKCPLAETARSAVKTAERPNLKCTTLNAFVEKSAKVYDEVEGHYRAGGFRNGLGGSLYRFLQFLGRFLDRASKPSNTEKGIAFERLTQLYLQTAPEYRTKLQHVWLLRDVPPDIRRRHAPRRELRAGLAIKIR